MFIQRISRSYENLDSSFSSFGDKKVEWAKSNGTTQGSMTEGLDKKIKAREGKTPYEIFLEDDGPYSRRLFAPVTNKQQETSTFTPAKCQEEEKKTKILKKGLLWHKDDGILSRQECSVMTSIIYMMCCVVGGRRSCSC